jgi:CubicO group peptidase (beta-lactamase class C family)
MTMSLSRIKTAGGALSAEALEHLRAPARVAVETGDVPGVVALVWKGGGILDVHATGVADVATGRPMEREAIFPIASMSKPVTVAAALRLLEKGKLRLEDPISRWAPEFADMRVLKRPDGPLEETSPAPRAITIEDLMTHRSGLTYGFTSRGPLAAELLRLFGFGLHSPLDPDAWMKALAALPLACAPGERFEYGHSIDVLGFVLARAAGSSLQEVMRRELFEPLGMADTGFWVPPQKRDRFVVNTHSPAPGEFESAPISGFVEPEPPAYASGGQGLVSSVDDYLSFARMLLDEGMGYHGRVLKPETVRLMTTNRLTPAQRQASLMGMPIFATSGLGLGVSVAMEASDVAGVGAFGWPGAFGGWCQIDPANDMVLIWLQACLPPPPQPGVPPRMPGGRAVLDFQRAAHAAVADQAHPGAR